MEEEVNLPVDQMVEETQIQILYLVNRLVLLSEIDEVLADIGQPDCKLINPCIIENGTLTPWLSDLTDNNTVMMSSDKILTMVEPNQKLLNEYSSITK